MQEYKRNWELSEAFYKQLEEAKQRTKEELQRNFNTILEGEISERKVWDIAVELSAPQVLIPEHFVDKDALIMVVDFGKFYLTNRNYEETASLRETLNEADDDEVGVYEFGQS